ncbi:glycosyltransferase [Zobellia galactanivorans]|uniref:glycosyltransferase n=1 Tax=Zobellia galactanivorans (strain DSM 12802 / CCUG 47099 / CIP 106680 / NCIMB 13871 / Dsij) TaxID=63186 RepID=UPI0026E32A0F|nr:glycosyltransferase [Zobellia galactanivorans]MDO6809969.1 glycosyltransferase [Zobellia galactanivorans]
MENDSRHIVFLGTSGFPYGLAAVQRTILMGKALLSENCKVTVVCRKGTYGPYEHDGFDNNGNFEGIDYTYTSGTVIKPKSFFRRNLLKIKGIYGEFKYLQLLKKNDNIDLALVSNMKALHLFRYLFFSFFFRIPVILNLVEMPNAMQERTKLSEKVNDYIVSRWLYKYFDGALPISDKLMDYYKIIARSRPSMKLPILCDYEKFNLPKKMENPYFLYCGSVNYMGVIDFVLECYKKLEVHHVEMYMIVSGGSKEATKELQDKINRQFEGSPVKLFSNIPYLQLVHLYNHAIALLIPLRPTLQDASRFPHKIGEYLASGNPVITTDVGEIKNYFKDGETALVAEEYSILSFTEKMSFVLKEPDRARAIGINGKELGLKEFDYKVHGLRMRRFFNNFL